MTYVAETNGEYQKTKNRGSVSANGKKESSEKMRVGRSFDDYLKQKGTYEETTRGATKIILAHRLEDIMKKQKITKVEMAKRLKTSRSQLDRLLDPENENVTLPSLINAARVVGRELILDLCNPNQKN